MALWKWGLKGASSVLWYGTDEALTHAPHLPQYPPTRTHVIWEGVTVHPNHGRDMTCCRLPLSVKYLCQLRRIALMAVKALTRALSLFCSPSFCLALTLALFNKFNKNNKKKTQNITWNKKSMRLWCGDGQQHSDLHDLPMLIHGFSLVKVFVFSDKWSKHAYVL